MPEGNRSLPGDDALRSLAKHCQNLFNSAGDQVSPYPEGCAPKPGDDEVRLLAKIKILVSAGADSSGSEEEDTFSAPTFFFISEDGPTDLEIQYEHPTDDQDEFEIEFSVNGGAFAVAAGSPTASYGLIFPHGASSADLVVVRVRALKGALVSEWCVFDPFEIS
jgi:hypothetical protein